MTVSGLAPTFSAKRSTIPPPLTFAILAQVLRPIARPQHGHDVVACVAGAATQREVALTVGAGHRPGGVVAQGAGAEAFDALHVVHALLAGAGVRQADLVW